MLLYKRVEPGQDESIVKNSRGKFTLIPPGSITRVFWNETFTVVPVSRRKTSFVITHETSDKIDICLKGIINFSLSDPVIAVQAFSFQSVEDGLREIADELKDHCRGELRDIVSNLTMEMTIRERNKTINADLNKRLKSIARGESGLKPWGIDVDVHVQQVFPADSLIQSQLQAETKDKIKGEEQLSHITSDEIIKKASIASQKKLDSETHSREMEKISLEQAQDERRLQKQSRINSLKFQQQKDEVVLKQEVEQERIRSEHLLKRQTYEEDLTLLEREKELLEAQKTIESLRNEVEALNLEREINRERQFNEIKRDILPIEQMPEIAASFADALKGSKLSVYGENTDIMKPLSFIVDYIAQHFSREDAKGGE